jgi:hypothetical protein
VARDVLANALLSRNPISISVAFYLDPVHFRIYHIHTAHARTHS